MKTKVYKRPGYNKKITTDVVEIIRSVSGKWFTEEVQGYVPNDMKFQDLIAIYDQRKMKGFIIYTCIDGKIVMMLMAIRSEDQRKGYGAYLYSKFEEMIRRQGFSIIMLQTIPQEVNENYKGTIEFYEKQGFKIVKHYTELWEHGAVELEKAI